MPRSLLDRALDRINRRVIADAPTRALNQRLKGYPRNHDYFVRSGALVPSRRLRERAESIARVLPASLGSFLEIGSCKGFFVLRAAVERSCPLAVGIDVHAPFIAVSKAVRDQVARARAQFYFASLSDVAADPARFGGPFKTTQLVSTYHYLFWGSELEPKAIGSHEAILSMLARVCGRFLVFANPLEISDCPESVQQAARAKGRCGYCRDTFLSAAARYFDVFQIGYMDTKKKRPLLLLVKRLVQADDQPPGVSFQSLGVLNS